MLADQLDYVVGVDPHRDSHALAVVDVRNGAVVFEANVAANSDGYRQALVLGEEYAPGRRVFAVEGTGSFGAGLARFLTVRGEQVLEVGRLRRERRSGGKTDALDAVRAARSVLTRERPATPRAGGERQALQALVAELAELALQSGRHEARLSSSMHGSRRYRSEKTSSLRTPMSVLPTSIHGPGMPATPSSVHSRADSGMAGRRRRGAS